MSFLNYHHLRYFRAIATEGNLTHAADLLRLSPSALSIQLGQLEESLGQKLFERRNKRLSLTEAGRIALDYANTIFRTGEEMIDALQHRASARRSILRVGAVATLSRNFQLEFLRPLLVRPDVEVVVRTGSLRELLGQLEAHTIDLVLSNLPVRRDAETGWHSHLLDEQEVSIVGRPRAKGKRFRFPGSLRETPIVLPSLDSNIRAAFDRLMDEAGIRPVIAAEVDDMAMLRLLARQDSGLAVLPPIVVKDELRAGLLVRAARLPGLVETFYAVTVSRRFPNPLLAPLLRARTAELER